MTAPDEPLPGEPLVKDMATTWDGLLRLLPIALRGWDYRIDGTRIEAGEPRRGITIDVGPLPPRQFGLVQIPRLQVSLAFHGLAPGERDAFLNQFDRAFQRGGG